MGRDRLVGTTFVVVVVIGEWRGHDYDNDNDNDNDNQQYRNGCGAALVESLIGPASAQQIGIHQPALGVTRLGLDPQQVI